MPEPDIFWDQLIGLIEEERVVPVVGQDLLRISNAGGRDLLYPYLAARLAEYLDIPADGLPEGGELHEVACRYLAVRSNLVEDIYPALKKVETTAETLPIPEPLLQLAAIHPFKLFVTTTFDSFLQRALDHVRYEGTPRTRVFAYSGAELQDLPADLKSVTTPIVYHLLGRVSAVPSYAVTQEDVVEFFHALQSETHRPQLLFDELNEKSLLILGSRFSGWLARFFIRMAKRERLSVGGKTDYVVDATVSGDDNLVLFLKNFSRGTKVFSAGGSVEFVNELHRRWMDAHPAPTGPQATVDPGGAPKIKASESADTAAGAVFLSYASEDRPIVEKIKNALEAVGIDVFFDQEDLHPGVDWERTLRKSIPQSSLFVPVISHHTLTSRRRFFVMEWNLALIEAQKAPVSEIFLLPVVIDDTRQDAREIPEQFRAIQWQALPGGQPTSEFVGRILQLYRKYQKSLAGIV
jgi:hypothetical protein